MSSPSALLNNEELLEHNDSVVEALIAFASAKGGG